MPNNLDSTWRCENLEARNDILYISRTGLAELEKQIEKLKGERDRKREEVMALSNSDRGDSDDGHTYHDAATTKQLVEDKVRELKAVLNGNFEYIDDRKLDGTTVQIGKTVTFKPDDSEDIESYTILGQIESDIMPDIISCEAELAQTLLGHKVDEHVIFTTASGYTMALTIKSITPWKHLQQKT